MELIITLSCKQLQCSLTVVSAVLVARPGNSDHRPLRLSQRKREENSRALTRPLRPKAIC